MGGVGDRGESRGDGTLVRCGRRCARRPARARGGSRRQRRGHASRCRAARPLRWPDPQEHQGMSRPRCVCVRLPGRRQAGYAPDLPSACDCCGRRQCSRGPGCARSAWKPGVLRVSSQTCSIRRRAANGARCMWMPAPRCSPQAPRSSPQSSSHASTWHAPRASSDAIWSSIPAPGRPPGLTNPSGRGEGRCRATTWTRSFPTVYCSRRPFRRRVSAIRPAPCLGAGRDKSLFALYPHMASCGSIIGDAGVGRWARSVGTGFPSVTTSPVRMQQRS